VFPPILLQISDDETSTEARQEGGSTEIYPGELRTSWIYYEKFLMDMRFLFRTLSFTTEEDDDLERPTQEQEEWHTTTIDFEFHRDLKDWATTFQAVVRQQAMTNMIDSPARPPIETPLMTIRSSGLAPSEIRIIKPEESA
jgi:hypothetical protein